MRDVNAKPRDLLADVGPRRHPHDFLRDGVLVGLQFGSQLAYTNAVGSYQKVTKLQPNNASAWFQLAQTAQQSGDAKTAIAGYKRYLKLNPNSTDASQIRALIKQLSPTPSG